MTIRDLIPWNRSRDVAVHRGENANPLLTLHREMNRVFDDVLRGFDVTPFGSDRLFDRTLGWPNIEVSETDKEVKVTAELPGLEEKDVGVELANGVLVSALPAGGAKAVEHCGLGVFEIRQGEDAFGRFLAMCFGVWHRRRPPSTVVDSLSESSSLRR